MKSIFAAFATVAWVAALTAAAMSQGDNGITQGEITNFNHFLDGHPGLAQQLAANPSLVDNATFLTNHPSLQGFLRNHPGVRDEIDARAGQFMYRKGRYEWLHGGGPVASAPGFSDAPLERFHLGYLDEHPEVAHQLAANPGLADNPQFLATHPGIETYLANHPEVRQELNLRLVVAANDLR